MLRIVIGSEPVRTRSKTSEIREEIGETSESLEMALEDLASVKDLAELLGLSKK